MPGLKMADSAVLREKPVISLGNVPASEWTLPRILKIKISRDTKQLFRKPSLPRMRRLLSLLFSTILFFLLSFSSRYLFLFLLTISRTPRGMSEQKKSFTLYARPTAVTGFYNPIAFVAPAEPSIQPAPGCEPDPSICDAVSYPQSSYSLPETCASSRE